MGLPCDQIYQRATRFAEDGNNDLTMFSKLVEVRFSSPRNVLWYLWDDEEVIRRWWCMPLVLVRCQFGLHVLTRTAKCVILEMLLYAVCALGPVMQLRKFYILRTIPTGRQFLWLSLCKSFYNSMNVSSPFRKHGKVQNVSTAKKITS